MEKKNENYSLLYCDLKSYIMEKKNENYSLLILIKIIIRK